MPESENRQGVGTQRHPRKGQLTLLFIFILAIVIVFTISIEKFGGKIGFIEIRRSIEVFTSIDDRGTGIVSLLGSTKDGILFMEHLGYPSAGGAVPEDIENLLAQVAEGRFNLEIRSGQGKQEIGSPPPKSFEEGEAEIPLPGAAPGNFKGSMVLKQW
jgi:hypothetical protein